MLGTADVQIIIARSVYVEESGLWGGLVLQTLVMKFGLAPEKTCHRMPPCLHNNFHNIRPCTTNTCYAALYSKQSSWKSALHPKKKIVTTCRFVLRAIITTFGLAPVPIVSTCRFVLTYSHKLLRNSALHQKQL